MKILFINNQGAGFADSIEVEEGTTIQKLFDQKMPNADPGDYLIRINRLPAVANEVLQPGSRVSITPLKIEGA